MVEGRRIAATVTVLIRADNKLAESMSKVISRISLLMAKCCRGRPSWWAIPVRVKPADRINSAQTVTTAGLLKPARASCVEIKPDRERADSTSKPTRSTRNLPSTKRTNAVTTMIRSKITSDVKKNLRTFSFAILDDTTQNISTIVILFLHIQENMLMDLFFLKILQD
jgi:hypothetical protein